MRTVPDVTRPVRRRHPTAAVALAALGVAVLGWPAAGRAQVTIPSFGFGRSAVPDTLTTPLGYSARINGTYDTVRLDLAAGGSLALVDGGGGLWTTTVPAADVLFAYDPADANHNFVGTLRVFQGTTQLIALNTFINVVDSTVAPVVPQPVGPNTIRACQVVNIWKPDLALPPPIADVHAVTQQFYQDFPDDFDFLNIVFSLPSYQANRFHRVVKNDVLGIGLSLFDGGAAYGSGGGLLGINQYPIDTLFDLAETASLHEMGHQWINFSSFPLLQVSGAHWPPGTLARGIMGYGTSQGLQFPYDLVDIGGGSFQMVAAPRVREFTDLDLYLMGLLDPADVDSNFVFSNPSQPICHGCSGPVTWFTVEDVIASQGPRVPGVATSPKEFRVATIVVTRDRFLDETELAMFNHFVLRGESTVPLPFTSGFEAGTTLPFHVATAGLGTLVTSVCPEATGAPLPAGTAAAPRLLPARPNPFRGATEIRFELASRQLVSLKVHDVSGRRVRVLLEEERPAGESAVRWDGRDGEGIPVASGVYFYRLEIGGDAGPGVTRRTVVLR